MQDKKDKGLCFHCDDKWTIGHRKKELYVLLTYEGEEEERDFNGEEVKGETEVAEPPLPEVSLNSVGLTNPKTMKVLAEVNGHRVIVMVDPKATHNFVSLKAVEIRAGSG